MHGAANGSCILLFFAREYILSAARPSLDIIVVERKLLDGCS
jgi:hypothetical protein